MDANSLGNNLFPFIAVWSDLKLFWLEYSIYKQTCIYVSPTKKYS